MNTTSAFPAEAAVDQAGLAPPVRKVLVWDAPVRVFHWLMALSFAGAYLSADSERWRQLHVTLGYTMVGLIAFRLIWGLVGTRHARFASFVRGPSEALRYLRSLVAGCPEHHAGHNPAGALAIVGLLGLTAIATATGWATLNDLGGEWIKEVHEAVASLMLGLVGVHVAAVLLSSWLHRDNLIGAMVTGRKTGSPQDGVRSAWRSVATLMLVAVLGFWWMQWQAGAGFPGGRAGSVAAHSHDHDDD
jgi:cytochrome b